MALKGETVGKINKSEMVSVMTNLHCHLDCIQNHHGYRPLSVPIMRVFSVEGRPTLKVGRVTA